MEKGQVYDSDPREAPPDMVVTKHPGSGEYPCTNCVDRKRQCVMSAKGRSRIKRREKGEATVQGRLARLEAMLQKPTIERHPSPTAVLSHLPCHSIETTQKPCSTSRIDQSPPGISASPSGRRSELASADHHGFMDPASHSNNIHSVSVMNACASVLEREHGGNSLSPLSAQNQNFVNSSGLPQMFNPLSDTGLNSSTTAANRAGIQPVGVVEKNTVCDESLLDKGDSFGYELVSAARVFEGPNVHPADTY